MGEDEKARIEFIRSAINAHRETAAYRTAADAEEYYNGLNPTINRYEKIIYDMQGRAHTDMWTANHKLASRFFGLAGRWFFQRNRKGGSFCRRWKDMGDDGGLGRAHYEWNGGLDGSQPAKFSGRSLAGGLSAKHELLVTIREFLHHPQWSIGSVCGIAYHRSWRSGIRYGAWRF